MSPRTVLLVASLSAGCSLFKFTVDTPATRQKAAEEQARQAEAERAKQEEQRKLAEAKAAEQQRAAAEAKAAEDQKVIAEVEAMRTELASKPDPGRAVVFADKVAGLKDSAAARDGKLDIAALSAEAVGHLEKAVASAPSYDLFLALQGVAVGPEGDAAVVRACGRARKSVPADAVGEFVAICLARAGGDAKQLKWPSAKADLAALRKAEEAKAKADAEAAKAGAANAVLAIAAVFAAGRCDFGDCMKNGWTVPTSAGEVRVRCNFGNCLKDGWTASLPGGGEARTSCSFGDCMKDGWETRYPDGSSARTRCSFSNCAKDGWETELPNGAGTARTRCSFGDCFKDGWETQIPGGNTVRCRCNFSKCLTDGTSCD
jgi:hypothetical protein